MTLEEAIKVCEDNAEKIGGNPQSDYHAACYKQVAEWLTELQDLREENKVLIQECDRLIKEKGELLKKSEQIAEYKRLLKAAVEDIARTDSCFLCKYYDIPAESCQTTDDCFVWRYADEALKLIGGNENG